MPPAPTGIATYSPAVLDGLRRIGFDRRHRDAVWPAGAESRGTSSLVPRSASTHLGNNVQFHRDIYRFACQAPGSSCCTTWRWTTSCGACSRRRSPRVRRRSRGRAPGARELLLGRRAARTSRCGSPWAAARRRAERAGDRAQRSSPAATSRSSGSPDAGLRGAASGRGVRGGHAAGARRRAPLSRGAARGPRRPDAWSAPRRPERGQAAGRRCSRRSRGCPEDVHLVARRPPDRGLRRRPGRRRRAASVARVTLAPDVRDDEFRGVALRGRRRRGPAVPHRGEVSGSLARAMQVGAAHGGQRDRHVSRRPRRAGRCGRPRARRTPPSSPRPSAGSSTIRSCATRMGAAARAHVAAAARDRGHGARLRGRDREHAALVRDPVRRAEARWAGALADIGVGEDELRRATAWLRPRAGDLQGRAAAQATGSRQIP